MSELRLSFPASAIIGKGKLTADDVALLKTETFPQGITDADDAALLFALHNSCRDTCPEWAAYFVDSISHFIVHRQAPQGMLDEANSLWLERMLAADGVIATDLELRLLMNVLEIATGIPDSLRVFALCQLRHAVHSGHGAYAERRRGPQRGISLADMDFVRLVVDAGSASEDGLPSPAIHRVLLSIDAVSNPALNEQGWNRLLLFARPIERQGRDMQRMLAAQNQRRRHPVHTV